MTRRRRGKPPAPPAAGSGPQDDALHRAFGLLAYTMNRHLVDHTLRVMRELDGDYQRMLILGVLSHLNVAHLMPPGSLPAALLDAHGLLPGAQQRLRPVILRDLAQVTGIPRETVRRKLEALAERGWVERVDNGWRVCVQRTDDALRGFTLEAIRRFLDTARAMEAMLRDVNGPVTTPADDPVEPR